MTNEMNSPGVKSRRARPIFVRPVSNLERLARRATRLLAARPTTSERWPVVCPLQSLIVCGPIRNPRSDAGGRVRRKVSLVPLHVPFSAEWLARRS